MMILDSGLFFWATLYTIIKMDMRRGVNWFWSLTRCLGEAHRGCAGSVILTRLAS